MNGIGGDADTTMGLTSTLTISEEYERAARALIRRRHLEDAAELEAMLFEPPHSLQQRTPAQLAMGNKLPADAKARIVELVGTGLSDVAIADQLGVSRQAVTGVRSSAKRKAKG